MSKTSLSKASISIIVYSIYLGSGGLGMALIPNVMLGLLGLPPTHEVWIRLFGALALVLAVKGTKGALLNLVPMMQLDVITRLCFAVFLAVLILIGLAPRILFIFAAIDFAASVWTQVTLSTAKREATAAT